MASLRFRKLPRDLMQRLVPIRHDLHAHPELAHQEVRTRGVLAELLRAEGIEVALPASHTGIIGLIRGTGTRGRTVALRADMDALPIRERTRLPYASASGCMHACGHDGHMTILLGTAMLLQRHRDRLEGNVKLVFQPAEETVSGASRVYEDGYLDPPRPDAVFGLHGWPEGEVGRIGVWRTTATASNDTFHISVRGRGSHASSPHRGIDPIVAAARIVEALQTLVSRETDPQDAVVITVGMLHAGDAPNVIPERAEITGTLRSLKPDVRERTLRRIRETARLSARSAGARARVEIVHGADSVVNDPEMSDLVAAVGRDLLGTDRVTVFDKPWMASEDFFEFLRGVPGAYFRLGIALPPPASQHSLHHPQFNFSDEAIEPGVLMMANIVHRCLSRKTGYGD